MKQIEIINKLPAIFADCKEINLALLIGSFARKQVTCKSDIDYSLWVKKGFYPKRLCQLLENRLPSVLKVLHVSMRNKIVVYFEDCPKLELAYYKELAGINLTFLGSEIEDISNSIQYQLSGLEVNIGKYLKEITCEKEKTKKNGVDCLVKELTDKFIYEFESASHLHKRSDSYKFYYFYNIAFNVAIQLNYISMGNIEHYYLPKNFAHIYETNEEQNFFRGLNGTLYLPEANKKKRHLLDFFYKAIEKIGVHTSGEIQDIKDFLETVYWRDYIWNFRDVAMINTKFTPNKLFRSSSLTRYQNEEFFADFIRRNQINKIVDLRAADEYEERPYTENSLKLFHHLHLSIDPRQQSEDFIKKYHYGTNTQIAYRHYALGHRHVFKAIFEQIDPEKDVFLIHCHAGKDRTGSVVALLSLLAGENIENIKSDYLESEMDTQFENLNAFLEVIEQSGNVEKFLLECEISKNKIEHWKKHLINDDLMRDTTIYRNS